MFQFYNQAMTQIIFLLPLTKSYLQVRTQSSQSYSGVSSKQVLCMHAALFVWFSNISIHPSSLLFSLFTLIFPFPQLILKRNPLTPQFFLLRSNRNTLMHAQMSWSWSNRNTQIKFRAQLLEILTSTSQSVCFIRIILTHFSCITTLSPTYL